MKILVSRLMKARSSFSRVCSLSVSINGRLLSTSSDNVDRPSKVEEADTKDFKPPPTDKLLVLGGNGFVGSHVCREALSLGLLVSSLSRSGRSSVHDSWADSIVWHQGDLLSPDSIKHAMDGVTSVISCVGGFGSNSYMYKINGSANINAIKVAREQGVKRFVYISAADFGLVNYVLHGYYDGKRSTESELMKSFPHGGQARLHPWDSKVGNINLPLSIIGAPLEMILQYTKLLTQIPLIGPLFIPPVNVSAVARVAVRAAIDPAFPPGIVDVYSIRQHSQQKSS